MKILPSSKLAKWSCFLIVAFLFFLLLFLAMAFVLNQKGGEHIYSNLVLFLPMLTAVLFAAASFVTGMISFFTAKERALLAFLSAFIGLLVVVIVILQFSLPE